MTCLGNHWLLDVLDIAIVTVIFYKLYVFIRSTRALSMFLGLLLIIIAGFLADQLGLHGLNWIISSLKTIWLLGFIIVFQPELRRSLSTLGQNPLIRLFLPRTGASRSIDSIVSAVFEMAESRTGALIVLLGNTTMKGVIDTGTPLFAQTSEELLLAIFNPRSPLHDGAAIIQADQILAAGCLLPLSQAPRLSRTLGTRHRAGIGITEESDCLAIVVSEETGTVSYARGGRLARGLTRESLHKVLTAAFEERAQAA